VVVPEVEPELVWLNVWVVVTLVVGVVVGDAVFVVDIEVVWLVVWLAVAVVEPVVVSVVVAVVEGIGVVVGLVIRQDSKSPSRKLSIAVLRYAASESQSPEVSRRNPPKEHAMALVRLPMLCPWTIDEKPSTTKSWPQLAESVTT
jgi:hypothetical protein